MRKKGPLSTLFENVSLIGTLREFVDFVRRFLFSILREHGKIVIT